MIGKPFINIMLSQAIENYLKYKEKPEEPIFSSFPVFVIRTLIFIYGELDIINPYITQNEHNMGGFDSNLSKYGFPNESVQDFKNLFLVYQKEINENKRPNTAFIKIEKYLIDMFFLKEKVMHTKEEVLEEFKKFLYIKENPNPYIQNDITKYTVDPNELSLYLQSVSYQYSHNFSLEELRRSTLIPEAYTLAGYTLEQISALNDMDLRAVNNQVYQFFKVDANLSDKDEILQKAVNYYKKYGNRITSGNGYVDFLLFSSILATAVFVLVLIFFY